MKFLQNRKIAMPAFSYVYDIICENNCQYDRLNTVYIHESSGRGGGGGFVNKKE